ncbi:MAG: caspase family protein [Novosphingobium sp.]
MIRIRCGRIVAWFSLLVGIITPCTAAHAETRALLVGVWQYQSGIIPDLKGPENDLGAMEALVRGEGAKDVTVLRNDQVSRTTVETALHALGLRAKPGDWIVFYYSGHGAQAEAAVKGTADGDLDQFLPLARFDPDKQDAERFIVDKDFYAWLARYIPRSVQVLMIADACHSGTLNRSIDPRAFHFTPRLAFRGDSNEIELISRPAPRFPSVLEGGEAAATDRADLPNLVYMAAAQDDQLALEASLPVQGAPSRGLLTYAFEQGLTTHGADGKVLAADLDGDGQVSVGEIASYVDSQVRALTAQRQQPRTAFTAGAERNALFAVPPPAPEVITAPKLPGVYAGDKAGLGILQGTAVPWRIAVTASDADFVLDSAKHTVLRRSGDVVAEGVTTSAVLRGVIEKWNAVETLRPLLSEVRARLSVGPEKPGARYRKGSIVTLSLETGTKNAPVYATVFDLASDGTVQLLYPVDAVDGEGKLDDSAPKPVMQNEVTRPFGADHVVALVSEGRPDALRALLGTVAGQRASARLVEPIRALLANNPGRTGLSVAEIYTGE